MSDLNRLPQNMQKTGPELISFLSGKGGVGKTILSFNLADRLVAMGKNVLLVDADFATGNIHIMANMNCTSGVGHFIRGERTLADSVTPIRERFDILASTWQGPSLESVEVSDSASLIEQLRKQGYYYDRILIDHSSGISNAATVIAHGSDLNVLVLVPELTSISDCYGLLKTLLDANRNLDCRLLINRAESKDEADQISEKFETLADQFLNYTPQRLGFLLENETYRRSLASQCTIAELGGDHDVIQALTELSQSLIRPAKVANDHGILTLKSQTNITTAPADTRE